MAKKKIDMYVFRPGMSYLAKKYPSAFELYNKNKDFILAEAMAFLSNNVTLGQGVWSGYTYNYEKCVRDTNYVINAVENDLRYGGNEQTVYVANHYWDNETAQVDGSRDPEILTHQFLQQLVTDFIFNNQTQGIPQQQAVPQYTNNSYTAEAYSFTPTAISYTPTTGVMRMTIGEHALKVGDFIKIATGSIVFTCAKDNHATLHAYPRASGVPNSSGTDPYYNKTIPITAVTDTTITVNIGISSDTSQHIFVSAVDDCVTAGSKVIVSGLFDAVIDTITNGLSSLPTIIENTYGRVKVAKRVLPEDLLLITNVTKGENIFTFTDPQKVAEVTYKKVDPSARRFLNEQLNSGYDADFPKFLQVGDYVSEIKFYYDTSSMDSTDGLQIFVEDKELRVRPYDFGTDAIERHRVAFPLSMLDADFEYGLQPTKWQAIGTLRGYPSIYEVPGTDTEVISVVTDASTGTGGIGQSLITVTTQGNHGFDPGTPITIKALENSITGAARAEGSFIITTVPQDNQFTFYAKAKVGTSAGQVLSTNYTQLRKGGFYTGANISQNPDFTVASNGSSGSFILPLSAYSNDTRLPFTGTVPELGAPLVYNPTGLLDVIPVGSQVTGVVGTGQNPELTASVSGDFPAGSGTISVANASGIAQGMSCDIGDGSTLFVSSVVGSDVTFHDNIGQGLSGDNITYNAVEGDNVQPSGNSATFDVTNTSGTYSVVINNVGSGYQIGDYIKISGNSVGGMSGTNDIEIKVTGADTPGTILSFTATGTAFDGVATYTFQGANVQGGTGSGALFDVVKENGTYTVSNNSPDTSINYSVNDRINIPGNLLGGSSPNNDCLVTVQSVGTGGEITSVSASGTATDAGFTYIGPLFTTASTGFGAAFQVLKTATSYTATLDVGGSGYSASDILVIPGDELDGASPANDLTITVLTVDGNGSILTFSQSGTGLNRQSYQDLGYGQGVSNLVGGGALFDVSTANGSYSVTVANGGADGGNGYSLNDTLVIDGSALGGVSSTNDCILTVSSIGASGNITGVNATGTAYTGFGTYTDIPGNNQSPIGNAGSFTILRNGGVYTVNINTAGGGYKDGNRILITGTKVGGQSPTHDIEITIATVGVTGEITGITYTGAANTGDIVTFYSTVTMSDNTVQAIAAGETVTYEALATITVNFPSAHGMVPGSTFITTIQSTGTNHDLAAGAFIATQISSVDSLSFQARSVGTIDEVTDLLGTIYPRPDSFFIHRPFDGGVQLGTGGPQHGAQAIRQSKKYIRYQSGKGIMYTTGALFAPSYDILTITANGTGYDSVITVETDDVDHGLQVGGEVRINGINTGGYNGDYRVDSIINERRFTVRSKYYLGSTTPALSDNPQVSTLSWHGATVRAGAYDDQNGIFMEYNGQDFAVVQRSATFQISGTVNIFVDSNVVTGTGTRFLDQLAVGDRIVIRGMTHVVTRIQSQTSMDVSPDFRGVTNVTGGKVAKVIDKRVIQRDFNLDTLDGHGPSGYDIDISKMQMIGIQYSWYGAGFIDYMLRGSDGNFVMFHRMRNSNINTEAFMRTGNMPVRYEIINESAVGKTKSNIGLLDTTIELENAENFPDTGGTLYIDNEIITYTGKSSTNKNLLTGCTRSANLINFNAGATRTYRAGAAATHTAKTGVVLISNTTTPIISHWGSAFITDGGFDSDRGYLFSYASTGIDITTTKATTFMIRLAPSVSNAIIGDLGERELLNRAQLLLEGLEITSDTSTGGIVVQGILNPQNYPINPSDVGWTGLSGLAQGGQPSFAQIAPGGSVNWNGGGSTTTATATTIGTLQTTVTHRYSVGSNAYYSYVTKGSWEASGAYTPGDFNSPLQGVKVSQGQVFSTGTTLTQINGPYGSGNDSNRYYILYWSTNSTGTQSQGSTLTLDFGGNLSGTNYLFFTSASWSALGAIAGTETSEAANQFPPGTSVASVQGPYTFGSTSYYKVIFTQVSQATINASTAVTFKFGNPPYAQPGETIFSFIANPGERSTIDLGAIKELTNTTLGGRGTFPNGPDVLAINVYKSSGTSVKGNIILRWSEAQA
jgi:hypothetical protein